MNGIDPAKNDGGCIHRPPHICKEEVILTILTKADTRNAENGEEDGGLAHEAAEDSDGQN